MNDYSEDFKGVRFPRNLWLDKSISLIEKGILMAIFNLGGEYSPVTNWEIAEFVQCSKTTVTRAIAHLKKLWYIEDVWDGEFWTDRVLKLITNTESNYIQDVYGKNALILNTYYQDE